MGVLFLVVMIPDVSGVMLKDAGMFCPIGLGRIG